VPLRDAWYTKSRLLTVFIKASVYFDICVLATRIRPPGKRLTGGCDCSRSCVQGLFHESTVPTLKFRVRPMYDLSPLVGRD
jgi:hypothetical protein